MTQALAVSLLPPTVVSASGVGTPADITNEQTTSRRAASVLVDASAFTELSADPAPNVLVSLQTSPDQTTWRVADSVTVAANGSYEFAAAGLDRHVRAAWTLTNITSVNLTVRATAHVVFCEPADLISHAVPEHSIEDIAMGERVEACITCTDVAVGYLGSAFELPILQWAKDLTQHTARLAAAMLFRNRGADPAGPDLIVWDAEKTSLQWFDRVSNGRLIPADIVDSNTAKTEGGSYVESNPSRGW